MPPRFVLFTTTTPSASPFNSTCQAVQPIAMSHPSITAMARRASASCGLAIFIAVLCFVMVAAGKGCECEEFQKQPVITYYVHDYLLQATGSTAFVIAHPSGNLSRGLEQGTLIAIRDLITEGPSATSRKLGEAQGVYLISSFDPAAPVTSHIHQQFTSVFEAEWRGSTIAYQGDDGPLDIPVREIAVVGGTGKFRRASGYCLISNDRQTDAWSYVLKFETHLWLPKPAKSCRG